MATTASVTRCGNGRITWITARGTTGNVLDYVDYAY